MQTENRVLDQVARFFTNAAGAAQAFRAEMETLMKTRFDRLVADLDLVTREEFDAVKAMAAKARTENEKLATRVAELEAKLGIGTPSARMARAKSVRPRRSTKAGSRKL